VFGWVNQQRARVAEDAAQKSRGEAEKMGGFLSEDVYNELAPTGRLDTLGKLAHRTVGYYDGLPADLVTPKTEASRAKALIREAQAANGRGDAEDGRKKLTEARDVYARLHDAGEHGNAIVIGLAQAQFELGSASVGGGAAGSNAQLLEQAAALLRPMVQDPKGPREAKLIYANALNYLSHAQPQEQGVATCAEARALLESMGALDLSDLEAAAVYADVADSEARHLIGLGRIAEAKASSETVYDLAEKVLAQRPNDLRSLTNRFYATQVLGTLARRRHELDAAFDYALRAAQAGEDLVRFNPADLGAWSNWILGLGLASDVQFDRGEIARSLAYAKETVDLAQDPRRPASLGPVLYQRWPGLALLQARTGDAAAAAKSQQALAEAAGEFAETLPPDDPARQIFANSGQLMGSRLALLAGDYDKALEDALAVDARVVALAVPDDNRGTMRTRDNFRRNALRTAARAAVLLGHGEEAEALARQWLALPPDVNSGADPRDESSRARVVMAHGLALQSRRGEMAALLAPALEYYRQQKAEGATETGFRFDYAYALYVSALDARDAALRRVDLDAATRLVAEAPVEVQALSDMRKLSALIASARAAPAG
jgi:hypothetical protein